MLNYKDGNEVKLGDMVSWEFKAESCCTCSGINADGTDYVCSSSVSTQSTLGGTVVDFTVSGKVVVSIVYAVNCGFDNVGHCILVEPEKLTRYVHNEDDGA